MFLTNSLPELYFSLTDTTSSNHFLKCLLRPQLSKFAACLVTALESEDPDLANDDEDSDTYPVTKQTLQMLIHDLQTVQQAATVTVNQAAVA